MPQNEQPQYLMDYLALEEERHNQCIQWEQLMANQFNTLGNRFVWDTERRDEVTSNRIDQIDHRVTQLLENAWMALCSEGEEKERALKASIEAIEKIEAELKGKTVFWRGKHWVFGPCTWMDLLLTSCLRGSWVHENCRPNPIPKHHYLDEQFSQPSSDQGHLPEIR
ncbi:unnamed protein product [Camellia sinensis]